MAERPEDDLNEEPDDDVIGDTAYSKSYIAGVLKKLLQTTTSSSLENWRENVSEQDMCTVWDMTAERDVAEMLINIGALELFGAVLDKCEDHRLLEIVAGIVANMSCDAEVTLKIKESPDVVKSVFSLIKSPDSLTLIQVLRFTSSVIYNDAANLETWLGYLKECDFHSSIEFILKNSTNKDVLIETLEALHSVCSVRNKEDNLFIEMFANECFIESLIIAFHELSKMIKKHKLESTDEERRNISFCSILSTLTLSEKFSSLFNDDSTEKLWIYMNEILKHTLKIESRSVYEVVESINVINFSFGYPLSDDSIETCKILIQVWQVINQDEDVTEEESSKKNNSASEDSELDFDFALANYFAKVLKFWPLEKNCELFGCMDKKFLQLLISSIKKSIDLNILDSNYNEVCLPLEKLLEKR